MKGKSNYFVIMSKERSVKCISCHTENKRSLTHCEKCGASLPVMKRSNPFRKRPVATLLFILLICAVVVAFFSKEIFPPAVQIKKPLTAVDTRQYEKKRPEKQEERRVRNNEKKMISKNDVLPPADIQGMKGVVAGWVIINDPWGRQVRKFRAGLAGSGWLALPARACLGGATWIFNADSGQEAEIAGGLWINGDRAGLWHVTEDAGSFDGPELAVWNESEPVSWSSLESDATYDSITLRSGRTEGFFLSVPLPDSINETGVFLQNSRIVGWTFGAFLPQGYMWPGREDLTYKTWVRYFYNLTFPGGREEKFAQALAVQKGRAGLEQLALFLEGFRLKPKLKAEDTPSYLLPEEIVKQVRILVRDAVRRGEGSRLVEILNSDAFRRVGDIDLFIDVVPVIAEVRGFEAAIREMEDSGRYIVRTLGRDVPALNVLHVQLYQGWIQSLISAEEVDEGFRAYNAARAYFPFDPYIHLLGVELELMNGGWEEAERLLNVRNYPADFQDRYQILSDRISEMKELEETIVIHFPRGSNRITLTAAVNNAVNQNFLVDTGASIVTIPSSTAGTLGLEIVRKKRTLATAGGLVTVSEVVLDSIEVEGWVEHDIRAIVLDMPDRPGLGLLGTNYLNRFRMDLKPEEGILLLTPQ